jgi:hypothetical protein
MSETLTTIEQRAREVADELGFPNPDTFMLGVLECALMEARLDEREACARLVGQWRYKGAGSWTERAVRNQMPVLANLIRARSGESYDARPVAESDTSGSTCRENADSATDARDAQAELCTCGNTRYHAADCPKRRAQDAQAAHAFLCRHGLDKCDECAQAGQAECKCEVDAWLGGCPVHTGTCDHEWAVQPTGPSWCWKCHGFNPESIQAASQETQEDEDHKIKWAASFALEQMDGQSPEWRFEYMQNLLRENVEAHRAEVERLKQERPATTREAIEWRQRAEVAEQAALTYQVTQERLLGHIADSQPSNCDCDPSENYLCWKCKTDALLAEFEDAPQASLEPCVPRCPDLANCKRCISRPKSKGSTP